MAPAPSPSTDVGATKAKTRGALLGGLKSGALEAAVAKMEEDTAEPAPEPSAEELKTVAEWGASVFQQFDTDKDGRLSKKELVRALRSLPKKKPKTVPPGANEA